MKRLSVLTLVLVFVMGFAAPGLAEGNPAVAVKLGTLGVQGELMFSINPYLAARLQGSLASFEYSRTVDDLDYEFSPRLNTFGGILDWHPGAGGFRLSGGVMVNSHDIDGKATADPNKSYKIGDTSYPGVLLGNLSANTEFNNVAPYVGLGYSNAFNAEGNWSFNFDLGVMWWGKPEVNLTSSNAHLIPGLEEDLKREEQKIEDELDGWRAYPVLQLGVGYSF